MDEMHMVQLFEASLHVFVISILSGAADEMVEAKPGIFC
jgi:hypothetical protein